ncbi:crAss001_48 related protein [Acinetobacter bereziniae]
MSEKTLQPHEQRVVEEKDQLKERLDKLMDFLQKGQPKFIDDKN